MKKLIFLFGQPGSGRTTLINNIYDHDVETLDTFDLREKGVFFIDMPYTYGQISYYAVPINRIDEYSNCIDEFLSGTGDIIVFKSGFIDFQDVNNSLLKKIAEKYPDLEKEILFLNPSDLEVGYERLKNTDWFKNDIDTNKVKYPFDWYRFVINYMREHLFFHEQYGYKVQEVDTMNGYKVHKDKPITLNKYWDGKK